MQQRVWLLHQLSFEVKQIHSDFSGAVPYKRPSCLIQGVLSNDNSRSVKIYPTLYECEE
jgi:hypothetical protein